MKWHLPLLQFYIIIQYIPFRRLSAAAADADDAASDLTSLSLQGETGLGVDLFCFLEPIKTHYNQKNVQTLCECHSGRANS